ncbi:hypothetical protein [Kibdelosporangium aridum]|uniref:hypothetical protein n=1 Tax=Kibdelosporangium aridum TaxID=2030 RepID=UPI000AE5D803|nr:hypothetical protein [Kibdelosporangium aridum]
MPTPAAAATGNGRVGFVDAEDIAAVATHALTDERAPNTDLVLTGPEALSYADSVQRITGRPPRGFRALVEKVQPV